jgi:hypothetical protein
MSRPALTAGSRTVLAVVAPKNNDDEQALGDQLYTALGLPLRGHWSTRKPKLMGHLHQYGTECLIVDDAHDLSLEHLMFIKEVTDQGRLQYGHPLGLCLVAAGPPTAPVGPHSCISTPMRGRMLRALGTSLSPA